MENKNVRVFITTSDQKLMFTEMESTKTDAAATDIKAEIILDLDQTFQEIEGFGGSLTDSSAYVMNFLPPEKLDKLMHKLFSHEDGIGLSYLRQTIGASDFAREMYSYAPEEDILLANFSIEYDKAQIIPLLRQAIALNPQLKFMASPWSPPAWMKTTGSMIGGQLRKEYYEVYANYIIKFIQAYENEGIKISVITPQNEPLFVPGDYPGCFMDADIQTNFIKVLGPKLRKHFPQIRLLTYDHNWDEPGYPIAVMEAVGEYVDGSAWHHYGGHVSAQSVVHNAFPDKEIHFTEGSGGEWVMPFENAFFGFVENTIGVLRHHGKSKILWNIALDEDNGPFIPAPERRGTCHGFIHINTKTAELKYNLEYYAMAHFSAFIKPGALRVYSSQTDGVENVAAINKDGSVVVVAYNRNTKNTKVQVTVGGKAFKYVLPGKSAATFVLAGENEKTGSK